MKVMVHFFQSFVTFLQAQKLFSVSYSQTSIISTHKLQFKDYDSQISYTTYSTDIFNYER
jgi:hypothetical protein